MFDNISETYDVLNLLLSFHMDYIWRKKSIQYIKNNPKKILDIATGTADLAIMAAKYTNAKITGVDISEKMLRIGNKKIKKHKLSNRISLELADAEKLPFKNNSFQAITSGFGVRNFESMDIGLSEMHRVLDIGGVVMILEPSKPLRFPMKQLYNIYFTYILPLLGKIISKDKSAYTYLTNSVNAFPPKEIFLKKLEDAGFINCTHTPLTFGIVSLYSANK
jgi:demethylmenaquinone methyltransferase/2-methoxy-6-polyprenyl-1,4-benzoquinol methylase